MKNIYSVFEEHLREHMRNKDKGKYPVEFNGICPFCGSTMHDVFNSRNGM